MVVPDWPRELVGLAVTRALQSAMVATAETAALAPVRAQTVGTAVSAGQRVRCRFGGQVVQAVRVEMAPQAAQVRMPKP